MPRKPKVASNSNDAVAAACDASAPCLARVEDFLLAIDTDAAQRTLGYEQRLPKKKLSARWLNAAGLMLLLRGDAAAALDLFRLALRQPFSPSHLAAAKNSYAAATLMPKFADDHGTFEIQAASQDAITRFQETNQALGTLWQSADGSKELAAEEASGVTIFDLPVAHLVCTYPLLDRHRHRHEWRGVEPAERWRRQYFDLLKRSLTRYLSRDLTEDVSLMRGAEAAAIQRRCEAAAESPGPEGAGLDSCDAPWHIGQGAGTPDGPWAQKYLSGLVHRKHARASRTRYTPCAPASLR